MYHGEEFYSGYWEDDTKDAFEEIVKIFGNDSGKALEYCIQFAYANIDAIKELQDDGLEE